MVVKIPIISQEFLKCFRNYVRRWETCSERRGNCVEKCVFVHSVFSNKTVTADLNGPLHGEQQVQVTAAVQAVAIL